MSVIDIARGDGRAKKADPQREVLHERPGPGNADAEGAADDDFGKREHDHRGQRQGGDGVFDERENRDHLAAGAACAGCCLRYASRALSA